MNDCSVQLVRQLRRLCRLRAALPPYPRRGCVRPAPAQQPQPAATRRRAGDRQVRWAGNRVPRAVRRRGQRAGGGGLYRRRRRREGRSVDGGGVSLQFGVVGGHCRGLPRRRSSPRVVGGLPQRDGRMLRDQHASSEPRRGPPSN